MHDGSSNMAVLEVSLISGYRPITHSLNKLLHHGNLKMRRYEVQQDKVLFFFEEVSLEFYFILPTRFGYNLMILIHKFTASFWPS